MPMYYSSPMNGMVLFANEGAMMAPLPRITLAVQSQRLPVTFRL